jgi:hypothetical protein
MKDNLKFIAFLILFLTAMGIVGESDYQHQMTISEYGRE